MTTKRILAGILCVMMAMTLVPMIAFANEGTVTTYATIEDITGYELVTVKTYDFTVADAQSLYTTGFDNNEVTFDTENGMTLTGSAPRWRFGSNNSSSLGADRAIYFRTKVTEGAGVMVYLHVPDSAADQDAYEISITPDAVTAGTYSTGTQMAAFVPGTDFVEYLAVDKKDGQGLFLYAKSAEQYEGKWVCVLNETIPNGSLSASSEVYFSGNGSVQEIVLYQEYAVYDSMEKIAGLDLLPGRTFTFTAENAQSLYSGSGSGCDSAEVIFDTTDGMTLTGSAPRWRIGSNNASSLGANKMIYFRMKADAEKESVVYFHVPDATADQDAYGVVISSTAVKAAPYTTGVQVMEFVPGTGSVEYLAVDREDGRGLLLYARREAQYDGKWACVLNETAPNGSLSASSEVYFTQAGSVQELILYGTVEAYDDIPDIVGANVYPYKSLNFTAANAEDLYSAYDSHDDTYDTTNGLVLADTDAEDGYSPRWRYYVADAWSAIADGRVVYFKAKLNSADENLVAYFKQPNDETEKQEQAYQMTIKADGVTSATTADNLISFAPGTDWVEYLVAKTETGMAIYAKKDGFIDGKWALIIHTATTSAISKNSAVYFAGSGSVQQSVIYTQNQEEGELPAIDPGAEIFDSIKDIMGKEVMPYKAFDMSDKNYQSQGGFVFKPSGEHTVENGAPIEGALEGGAGFWRYNTGTANWSPLTSGARGVYFKAKVEEEKALEVKVQNPAGENKYGSFTISPTAFGENNFVALDYAREGGAGTDFVEYFMVADVKDRVKLYAKGLTDDGKWVLAAAASGYANSDSASIGLYFAGDGFLKEVKLYQEVDESLLYDTMADIIGEGTYPYKDFKFTEENAADNLPVGKYDQAETSYDAENGLTLSGEAPRWRFADADGWSAIDNDRVIYFKAKVPAGKTMPSYFKSPVDETEKKEEVYTLNIAAAGVTSDATAEVKAAFAPGTDWAEYLIVKTETGMAVYARQDGFVSGKWMEILHVTATTAISKHSAVYFTQCGSIQGLTIYDTNVEFTTKDTLGDITGTAYAAQNFIFRPGFDVKLNGGTFPQGEDPVIDENGMKIGNGQNWRFYQTGNGWSPLDNGDSAVFRAKVSDNDDVLEVLMKSPLDEVNKAYLVIQKRGVIVNGGADVDMKFNFVPGTDWAEYLVKANENDGYDVWVKAALFGNEKWYLLAETTAYNNENGSKGTGFRLRGNATCDAYVDYVKIYADENIVEESATKPAEATFSYFEEEFNAPISIQNTTATSMSVAEGNLIVDEGKGNGDYSVLNGAIPKGGYAEFKTAGPGVNRLMFYDGTDCLQLSFNGYAAEVGIEDSEQGVDVIDITDGGNIYRIWRVVRNLDGTYNGYTKLEEETLWVKAFENKVPVPDTTPAKLYVMAGNEGVKYDYIRIYGAEPEKEFTIYDGLGTKEVEVAADGTAEISYHSALRVAVRGGVEDKTLILAEVKDGLLLNLAVEEIKAEDDLRIIDYSMKDKNSILKILTWESLASVNNLNGGIYLTTKQ